MKNLHLLQQSTYDVIDSPIGELIIITSAKGLHAIVWDVDSKDLDRENLIRSKGEKIIVQTKKQLAEYFVGKRETFDLPLVLNGTPFQIQVWRQLQKIPYGETISYGEQAKRIGDKNKARPVGMANGRNPIPVIIPCHRVIGSNGKLVGFGGGLSRKEWLLNHERK